MERELIERCIITKLNKSVFSSLRQLYARHCLHLLQVRRAAIDRYLLHAGRSAANPPLLQSIDGTDGRRLDCFTDTCSA